MSPLPPNNEQKLQYIFFFACYSLKIVRCLNSSGSNTFYWPKFCDSDQKPGYFTYFQKLNNCYVLGPVFLCISIM